MFTCTRGRRGSEHDKATQCMHVTVQVEKPTSEKVEKTTKKDKSEVQEKKTEKKEIPDKIGKISEKPLLKPEMTESNFSFQGSSATKEVKKKTGFAPTNDEMRDSAKNVAVRALSKL